MRSHGGRMEIYMKYGCIGEHLKHSFSKEIHGLIADYEYEIREIPKEELTEFLEEKDFLGINVTIPYKEAVIPYLYYIDEAAKAIGAVNTVVNKNGKLYGYNTDFYGMRCLIEHAKISLSNKKVIILGTGGTSKTAYAVAKSLGAKEILKASRNPKNPGEISYEELYENHTDAEVIINTTPSGMYPNIFDAPADISKFASLTGVIDAIYNPLMPTLIAEARKRQIPAECGLYMLVAQAVRASEIFLSVKYPDTTVDTVYEKILKDKRSIVLTGMPASGKSTVGKALASKLGREFIDTDSLIEEKAKKSIKEIFAKDGELAFRDLESEVMREVSAKNSVIIATGGGAILREKNVDALKKNGKIYFIDRPLSQLIPTDSRPLASDREAIEKRYKERYSIYKNTADCIIDAGCTVEKVVEKIINS